MDRSHIKRYNSLRRNKIFKGMLEKRKDVLFNDALNTFFIPGYMASEFG